MHFLPALLIAETVGSKLKIELQIENGTKKTNKGIYKRNT
jgi:hypothetical protein